MIGATQCKPRSHKWYSDIVKRGWVTRKKNQALTAAQRDFIRRKKKLAFNRAAKHHAQLSKVNKPSSWRSERAKKAWVTRKANKALELAAAQRQAQLFTPRDEDGDGCSSVASVTDEPSGQFNLADTAY